MNATGFVQALYNRSTLDYSSGLAVKVAGTSPSNVLLDLSTAPTQNTQGKPVMMVRGDGNVGIGTNAPGAPLQFANTLVNRKIVLYANDGGQHSFYGFGINPSELRYQSVANHVFYAATSPDASRENFRINANGRVGIGNSNPSYTLDVNGGSRIVGDFIHTSADGGGTWVYLTNTNTVPTGWKLVTTASPAAGSGGDLHFYNDNNTPALTLQQNGTVGAGGNLNIGGDVSAGGKIGMGLQQVSTTYTISAMSSADVNCGCPAGTRVIGGGGGHRDPGPAPSDIKLNFSGPQSDGSGWRMLLENTATTPRTVIVRAICARVQ